ncbi:MAG: Hsp70 family protein, partial [Dactylosporangium sp.]|nr:Hsp70 family protein [Dactylosporangium sp.]
MGFDGGPTLSVGVFAAENGTLVVGRDAERGALRAPGRFEPSPKRRIDEGQVLLGDREYDVSWLIGAVMARAYSDACRLARTRVQAVVLPYPIGWGQRRRTALATAATAVGLPAPRLVPEPIAAAFHFIGTRRISVPPGRCVLVYDLGGGTFEATVLRRTPQGFEVLATGGLSDVGGNDIDAAIVAYLREQVRPDDTAWGQLTRPESSVELHAARALWDGVRSAKERLSRAASVVVSVPLLGVDAPLGREQFEQMARPILERTVEVSREVLGEARVPPADLAGVFPVDGSSRIPLVTTLLHRALGVAPTSIEEPHLAVALGSLIAPSLRGATRPGAAPVTPPHGMPPQGVRPQNAPPARPQNAPPARPQSAP